MSEKWKVKVVQSIKYDERLEGSCDTYEEAVALCQIILKVFPETEVSIKYENKESNRKPEEEEDK